MYNNNNHDLITDSRQVNTLNQSGRSDKKLAIIIIISIVIAFTLSLIIFKSWQYYEKQRMINEVGHFLSSLNEGMEESSQKFREKMRRQRIANEKSMLKRRQKLAQDQRIRKQKLARQQSIREQKIQARRQYNTMQYERQQDARHVGKDLCQFWVSNYLQNPTERNKNKKIEACTR